MDSSVVDYVNGCQDQSELFFLARAELFLTPAELDARFRPIVIFIGAPKWLTNLCSNLSPQCDK